MTSSSAPTPPASGTPSEACDRAASELWHLLLDAAQILHKAAPFAEGGDTDLLQRIREAEDAVNAIADAVRPRQTDRR